MVLRMITGALAMIVVVAVLTILSKEPPEPQLTAEEERQLIVAGIMAELFPPPPPAEITCRQLFDKEKFEPDAPNPQVACLSNGIGFHYWFRVHEDGKEEIMFYTNTQTNFSTGFFSINPEKIKVIYEDQYGQLAESVIEIDSDFQPCMPPLCKQVSA